MDRFTPLKDLAVEGDELRDKRDRLKTELEQIHLRAGDRALDAGEQERFENVSRAIERVDADLERVTDAYQERQTRETVIREVARNQSNTETGDYRGGPADDHQDRGDPRVRGDRDAGLRAIERYSDTSTPEATQRLEELVRRRDPRGIAARYLSAVGDPNYESAFAKVLRDPAMGHLRFGPEEVEAFRRVSAVEEERAFVTTTTGIPIPYQLDPTLVYAGSGALNPFRQICRVETVTEGTWKGVNTTDVTLAYSAEAVESTDSTPTLVQPTIVTQRCIGFIPFSIESGQDWGSLASELTAALDDGKNVLDATAFLTGTGSNAPGGVLNIGGTGGLTTTQRILTTTTAVYALGDPYLLKAGLPPRFISAATYVAAPGIWDVTYRFVGGNSTEPFQMPDRGGPMLGRPKVELSSMVTTTTTGSKIMMLGDFRTGYLIADRLGMQVELIPHLFGATNRYPTGQRGLFAIWRTGGGVVVPNALRYLEIK